MGKRVAAAAISAVVALAVTACGSSANHSYRDGYHDGQVTGAAIRAKAPGSGDNILCDLAAGQAVSKVPVNFPNDNPRQFKQGFTDGCYSVAT